MLNSVLIRNFRSCRETKLELGRTLCAISGRNGVGKSNILKAIEWACTTVIFTDAVRLGLKTMPGSVTDNVSLTFELLLEGNQYRYQFNGPVFQRGQSEEQLPLLGIVESLEIGPEDGRSTVFKREGEHIDLPGRNEQIRVPRTTPGLAALHSLLAGENPSRVHVNRLMGFFGGIRYYSLQDRPEAKDFVTEQSYNEWRYRYQNQGELTSSVAMRLIYMWQEERELFQELLVILGPNGMNVVEDIVITPMVPPATSASGIQDTGASSTKLFMPLARPSAHMGGAGRLFPFSDLSAGTRRVVEVVASMLFDRRSVMLMEQPEDSIHPGLLRRLIDQLRTYSHDTQMLFTTHSLEVLDILRPEEILLATAPNGSTRVRKLTPVEIERAKDFLKNEGALSDFLEPLDEL